MVISLGSVVHRDIDRPAVVGEGCTWDVYQIQEVLEGGEEGEK